MRSSSQGRYHKQNNQVWCWHCSFPAPKQSPLIWQVQYKFDTFNKETLMFTIEPEQNCRLPQHVFKHCPKCRQRNLTFIDPNQLRCQTCNFLFFLNPAVTTIALLRNSENQLLLTRRKIPPWKGKLDFPGGFVNPAETLEEAVAREIREELHLELSKITYFGSFTTVYPYEGIIYQPVDTVFDCRVIDWQQLEPDDDVAEVCFYKPEEINPDDLAFSSNIKLLNKILKNSKSR